MEEYQNLIEEVLVNGQYKENRTGVDTISLFNYNYEIDLQKGFPLLTTKKMDGARWNSLVHELLWYLSGEHHIRNFQDNSGIWDAWADDEGNLETAYGRFWRNFPVPGSINMKDGENWVDLSNEHMQGEKLKTSFDQIGHVIKNLKENPNSRRHVVTAWHPANAATSLLPPCHYTFVFNVQNGNELNCHLSQRSGDVALGVPFNIASYALLTHIIANETGLEVGSFAHSITDAHIYCGKGDRGKWYKGFDRLGEVRWGNAKMLEEDIKENAPGENEDNYDHIPNLLRQYRRNPLERSEVEIADKPIDELKFDDFTLKDYDSYDSLSFGVAE